jgi:Protein of unknown function (DUF2442)
MLKDIIEARSTGGHRLYIRFEDGVEGEIDLAALITFQGVFEPLEDPAEVAKVRVDRDLGTICWENGADLDPDVLYATLTGQPIELRESAYPTLANRDS